MPSPLFIHVAWLAEHINQYVVFITSTLVHIYTISCSLILIIWCPNNIIIIHIQFKVLVVWLELDLKYHHSCMIIQKQWQVTSHNIYNHAWASLQHIYIKTRQTKLRLCSWRCIYYYHDNINHKLNAEVPKYGSQFVKILHWSIDIIKADESTIP